jgi:hypothetical protein
MEVLCWICLLRTLFLMPHYYISLDLSEDVFHATLDDTLVNGPSPEGVMPSAQKCECIIL